MRHAFLKYWNRFKNNLWLVEVGVFSILYGVIIEVNHDEPQFEDFELSWDWISSHSGHFFILAGILALLISVAHRSMRLYMLAISVMAVAAMSRMYGIVFKDTVPITSGWVLLWAQVLILQIKVLSTVGHYRSVARKTLLQKHQNTHTHPVNENTTPHYSNVKRGIKRGI